MMVCVRCVVCTQQSSRPSRLLLSSCQAARKEEEDKVQKAVEVHPFLL